jgi:hypothetical protein
MTPMESLLNAIDKVEPITKKRKLSMSIDSIIEKRQLNSPPLSPKQPNKVTCYHASIAQKSYGTEKRFLCPPPIVISQSQTNCMISMTIMNENNQPILEQRTLLDDESKGYFKYLYVTSSAKSKQFRIKLNMNDALFYSNPISIISKPSKKTAKTRNATSCLFNHSTISLFNRINSQTVRTKYMSTESNQLCAKHSTWSPFEIIVLRQPNKTEAISYGTEILLKDIQTGITSPPLIIRKVEKNKIIYDAFGLLSQMQKVALQLANNTSDLFYLNSNGKTIENDLNNNVYIDFTEIKDQQVSDYLCWTIVGINKFEYEFIKQPPIEIQQPNSPPPSPPRSIIPFPTISCIQYIPSTHSIRVPSTELNYYLGRQGPLKKKSLIEFELPDIQEIILNNHNLLSTKQDGSRYLELPILLSKPNDTFIYHSSKLLSFTFLMHSPELGQFSILDCHTKR